VARRSRTKSAAASGKAQGEALLLFKYWKRDEAFDNPKHPPIRATPRPGIDDDASGFVSVAGFVQIQLI